MPLYADEEFDDEDDFDPDDGDDAVMPCPHCGAEIHEDSQRCHSCGQYLSREDAPSRKPWWIWLGVVACLLVVVWWLI